NVLRQLARKAASKAVAISRTIRSAPQRQAIRVASKAAATSRTIRSVPQKQAAKVASTAIAAAGTPDSGWKPGFRTVMARLRTRHDVTAFCPRGRFYVRPGPDNAETTPGRSAWPRRRDEARATLH